MIGCGARVGPSFECGTVTCAITPMARPRRYWHAPPSASAAPTPSPSLPGRGGGDDRSHEAIRGDGSLLTISDLDRIWFGCGNFGGIGSSPKLRSAGDSEQTALRLLDHARRVGLRRFDTANTYGGGASEIILGKWLRSQGASFRPGRPNRDQGRQSPRLPARRDAAKPRPDRLAPRSVAAPTGGRADRPLLHSRIRPRDAARRDARRDDARSRSRQNRPLRRLQRLAIRRGGGQELAGSSLAARFEYVQNEYNLLATADAEALIPYCAEHGLRYTAFSPLAGGLLTGKYRFGEERRPAAGWRMRRISTAST